MYRYWANAVIKIKFSWGATKNNNDGKLYLATYFRVHFGCSIEDLVAHCVAGFFPCWNSANIKPNIHYCFLSCWRKNKPNLNLKCGRFLNAIQFNLAKKTGRLTYYLDFSVVIPEVTVVKILGMHIDFTINLHLKLSDHHHNRNIDLIGHFRVLLCLCFKASPSAKPFLWKWLWFAWKRNCMQNSFSYERFRT